MSDLLLKLWRIFCAASSSSSAMPEISALDVSAESGISLAELPDALKTLVTLGAVQFFEIEDLTKIAKGFAAGGECMVLLSGEKRTYMRVTRPESLKNRLDAQMAILDQRRKSLELEKTELQSFVKLVGITEDQLVEIRQYDLSDGDVLGWSNMPERWFSEAYMRMKGMGKTDQMVKIAAVALRMRDRAAARRDRGIAVVGEQYHTIKSALEFVSKVITPVDIGIRVNDRSNRQAISESVRQGENKGGITLI